MCNSNPFTNPLDVIIIMGQSNIDGRAEAVDLPAEIPNPNPNVKIWKNGNWSSWQSGQPPVSFTTTSPQQWGPDTVFLELMYQYKLTTQYVIKKSRGGTAFIDSIGGNGDWNIYASEAQDHYLPFLERINQTDTLIKSSGYQMRPKFLWCDIGETDCVTSDKVTFKADFKNFIWKTRNKFGNKRLPIVHRKLDLVGTNTQWLIDAQMEFEAGEINDYYLIHDTYTYQDALHLDADGCVLYANNVFDLVKDW